MAPPAHATAPSPVSRATATAPSSGGRAGSGSRTRSAGVGSAAGVALGIAVAGFAGFIPADANAQELAPIASDGTLQALPPPPAPLVAHLHLAPSYVKYLDADGIPIVASRATNDAALREAAYLVHRVIGHRPDVEQAIARNRIRVVVMARTELTTDVPEHADLTPKAYWDCRARGLGASRQRPATSAGEENLLELVGDPYATENIFIHEFAHTVHQHGMTVVDPTFQARLEAAYAHARTTGLWKGTYASENVDEYWAEASQSWFDTNRVNDNQHGPIDTRAKLLAYDPQIAVLLTEAYGNGTWRYVRPSKRVAAERGHLAAFDARRAGPFTWSCGSTPTTPPAPAPNGGVRSLPWRDAALLPARTPSAAASAATIRFTNQRRAPIAIDWIDFGGAPKRYATLPAGASYDQATYDGHVWRVSEGERPLGGVVASGAGRVDVR